MKDELQEHVVQVVKVEEENETAREETLELLKMPTKKKRHGHEGDPTTPKVYNAEDSWQGADDREVVSSRHGGEHECGREQRGEDRAY